MNLLMMMMMIMMIMTEIMMLVEMMTTLEKGCIGVVNNADRGQNHPQRSKMMMTLRQKRKISV